MADQDTTLTPTTPSVEPSSSSETVQTTTSEATPDISPVENTSSDVQASSVTVTAPEASSATPAVPTWMNSVGVVPAPVAESSPSVESTVQTESTVPAPAAEQAEAKRGMFDAFKTGFLNNLQFLQKRKQQMTGGAVVAPADSVTSTAAADASTSSATAATTTPVTPAVPGKLTDKEKRELLEAEKIYQNGLSSIRDLISPSSMEIRYDMIRVDGLFAQTFYVFTYPRYLDMNWMSPLINFEVSMDIAQFIYPIDSATIMKILRKKVTQMQSSIHMDQEKGKTRDPAIETALEDAEQLRTEIQRGQEKFFQFALYFTIYADDEKKIQNVAKQLESLLGGKLIMTRRAQIQAEQGFNSTLPISLDQLYVVRNMNTSPLSTTFPFTSSTLTSDEGILYGVNRHNDSLIIFDRFALENANSVVFAKSGAGKSYAVKLEITRMLMLGTDVIIIDPENEYEALAQTLGGTYLRLSLNSDRRINPFDLPPPLADDITQPGDILRQNVITLIGLLKVMLGEMTPVEEGILDKALIDVYALKGITMDVVDPSTFTPPTMEDLYDLLSTMEGASNLAQRLQKFTSGTYSGLFNKPTNLNLGTGLMVFCIRDLDEALRPIAMYIILNYIWAQVRRELKRRILVIDEAWSIMQHGDSARFLFGLVKRARKYYLGITTITQDVEDFFKSEFGKPIITNSSMQLLLKQAPAAMDYLGKVFNLTEGEKYILLNSGVGQGLFFAGNKHAAIQIIASYGEDQIVTTNPEQLLKKIQDNKQASVDATAANPIEAEVVAPEPSIASESTASPSSSVTPSV